MFGDRCPEGYTKFKLLSKLNSTLYWLTKKFDPNDKKEIFCIVQQIPKSNEDFESKLELIKRFESSELYEKILQQQGMRNLIVDIDEIIDEPE